MTSTALRLTGLCGVFRTPDDIGDGLINDIKHFGDFCLGVFAGRVQASNFNTLLNRQRATTDQGHDSILVSVSKRVEVHPMSGGEIAEANGFSVVVQHDRIASVPVLSFACRPSTVSWFVISVVILAIEGVLRRTWPHIGIERLKGILPLFAHRNPASAVIEVSGIVGVEAPTLGVHPGFVFPSPNHAVTVGPSGGFLFANAATASLISVFQVARRYNRLIATLAGAVPERTFSRISIRHHEVSEFLARKVYQFRHSLTAPVVSLSGFALTQLASFRSSSPIGTVSRKISAGFFSVGRTSYGIPRILLAELEASCE